MYNITCCFIHKSYFNFLYFVIAQDGPLLCETNPITNCWNGTQVLEIEEEETFTSDNILDQSKTLQYYH